MKLCPYCGGKLKEWPVLPQMPARRKAIYEAVARAGPDGIQAEDLIPALYTVGRTRGREPSRGAGVMLRVQVYELNKQLKPFGQKISARHNNINTGYILTKTGEDDGKTTQESTG